MKTFSIVADLLRVRRQGQAALALRQQTRLHTLLSSARANSRFYQRLYSRLPADAALEAIPPVTKQELMASFDDWVCDPRLTLAGVEAFVAGPEPAGTPYLGEYFVCSTSGTTGNPGIFVHDRDACRVYHAMSYPLDLAWLSGRQWFRILSHRVRWAVVVGTGGHFAGEGWIGFLSRRHWWRRDSWKAFSLQRPLAELVRELNAFQPAIVTSYPSALDVLAAEQLAGRLQIHPLMVELGGESAGAARRNRIAEAFGDDVVHDSYSASECLVLAFDCAEGWLQVNADWVILEPVEADYSPTPRGRRSHTVLLTNLANKVQPIIRYDLGDSVAERPDPCPCGSPLPAIRVEGRCDDVLHFTGPDGHGVDVLPLAVGSVVDECSGVLRSQLIRSGPSTLTLRLDVRPNEQPQRVWDQTAGALADYLADQGLPNIDIVRSIEAPQRSPTSGKFRQVIG